MAAELEVRRRKNMRGVPCVAPFIRSFNVCDLPVGVWSDEVGRALVRAYELGWQRAPDEMAEHLRKMPANIKTTDQWEIA